MRRGRRARCRCATSCLLWLFSWPRSCCPSHWPVQCGLSFHGTAWQRRLVSRRRGAHGLPPAARAGSLAARCSTGAGAGPIFSLELGADRDDPLAAAGFTPDVDEPAPQRVPADGVPSVPTRRLSVRSHRVVLLLSVGLWHLAVHAAPRTSWGRVPGLDTSCLDTPSRRHAQVHRRATSMKRVARRGRPWNCATSGPRSAGSGAPSTWARRLFGIRGTASWERRRSRAFDELVDRQAARPHAPLPG